MNGSRRFLPAGFVALALAGGCRPPATASGSTRADRGPVTEWAVFEGTLEARRMELIMSGFNGGAVIVDLAPEGAEVAEGDPIVRFDDSQVQRELVALERDYALARSERESLERAILPMEASDLELKILEAQADLDAEVQFLEDNRELLAEALVTEQEIAQQQVRVDRLRKKLERLEQERTWTTEWLHPARRERALAKETAAQQELALARAQRDQCAIRAPAAGRVVYRLLQLGAEYRTVRLGDTVFKNQPFMMIPDLANPVVRCLVPESELAKVEPGRLAVVEPLAYPGLAVTGNVESVGAMAQSMPGRPSWQKFFRVGVGLDTEDERLRTGMTARVRIRGRHGDDALRVPRSALTWTESGPAVQTPGANGPRTVPVTIGALSDEYAEILAGLAPGDAVLIP